MLIKKILPIFLCSSFLLLHAQSDSSKQEGYDSGTFREITPNAGPRVSNGSDIFITADFIWWKSRLDGLAYALSGYNVIFPTPPSKGQFHQVHFDYEPGFKVGLGLNLNHDGWDLFAQYTWLNSRNSRDSTKESDSNRIGPYWFMYNEDGSTLVPQDPLSFASGKWKLLFNVIDLELGRNFFISQYLTLRPHAGLKGTLQDQTFIVKYTTSKQAGEPIFYRMGQHEDFWGVGIRGGINTAWHLTKRWSFFGDLDLTALWSSFDIRRRDREREETQEEAGITFNTKNKFCSLKPILELSIGLRWEIWFYDDDYHLSLQAGWEEQIWWSRNQFIRNLEESAHGDLIFHGLTLKGRFDF